MGLTLYYRYRTNQYDAIIHKNEFVLGQMLYKPVCRVMVSLCMGVVDFGSGLGTGMKLSYKTIQVSFFCFSLV